MYNITVLNDLLQKYQQANRITIDKLIIEKNVDGLEAYQQTKEKFYDIIFMNDYNPKLNGNDSVKKIRKFQKKSSVHEN